MLSIPQSDSQEFCRLSEVARATVIQWLPIADELTGRRPLFPACKAVASRLNARGFSAQNIARKMIAWERAHDWRVFLPKQLEPRYWQIDKRQALPAEFVEYWKQLCQENARCNAQARVKLVMSWRRRENIPGYESFPGWPSIPSGWSKANLARLAPSKFELAAARIGRSAAADHRPMVYTTRQGLWVGSHYLFDDLWHDHFVNVLDTRKTGRPLEFHSLDLFSACKVAWGMKVRTENDLGINEGLRESQMRFLLAYLLGAFGYSQRGTVMVVEHGTAAIREDLEKILFDVTGGKITVSRSGMQGAPAFAGQYAGRSKGNFRFKAALESAGSLYHNAFGFLPGQTGPDAERRPEQLHGMLRHNDALLAAMAALPEERARLLRFDLLEFRQFQELAADIYGRINSRTDHDLEGWERQCTPDPVSGTMRRLSPLEVWQIGARDLVKIPPHGLALILSRDLGTERSVRSHMFQFEDKETSVDLLRFDATALVDGETYLTVLNPFAPDRLFAFDAAGRFIADCPRIQSICRGDVEALHRACGRVAHIEKTLLEPVARRGAQLTRQRIENARWNADVLAGAPMTPEAKRGLQETNRFLRHLVRDHGQEAADNLLTPGVNDQPQDSTDGSQDREEFLESITEKET